jgi:microcin C transport system substrate-binding protein
MTHRFTRRHLLAGLAGSAAAAGVARIAFAQTAGETIKGPSLAMHGAPKYRSDFAHFDYVNPQAPKGGSLYTGVGDATFDSLNPFILKGTYAGGIATYVFDTVMRASDDEPFSRYPLIAKSIETPKDRAWVVFEIDERARFHDGSPITAEDVAFSLETLLSEKAHPFYRQYYKDVAKIERADRMTLRIVFKTAGNRELPLILTELAVFSKAYWSKREFDRVTLDPPLGSGPYKIGQFAAGRYITFERVKDYWAADLPSCRGYNNFDLIRVDYFRDDTVAREGFKAGEFDYQNENSAIAWATQYNIEPVRRGELVKRPIPNSLPQGMQAFVFNTRRPNFTDSRVRRALAYVFDFEWSNKNLFYGQYVRTKSYFANSEMAATGLPEGAELKVLEPFKGRVPDSVFKEPYTVPTYTGDGNIRDGLRQALALLKEAGWEFKDGRMMKGANAMRIEAMLDSQTWERVFLPYAQNLKRLGIVMDVRLVDPTQYQKRIDQFDFDVIMASWGQSESPGNEQRDMWSSAAADTTGSSNFVGVKDKAIDELIELVIAAPDREQLVARTKALDRVLLHHHFVVPCWHIAYDRILYWDKFGVPEPHRRGTSTRYWWLDAAKAQRLKGKVRSQP